MYTRMLIYHNEDQSKDQIGEDVVDVSKIDEQKHVRKYEECQSGIFLVYNIFHIKSQLRH